MAQSSSRLRSSDDGAAYPKVNPSVVTALNELGFSQYEARTYLGLIGQEPMTGYGVAKLTQVPQPKVYETLGRLVERGAVLQASDNPAKFIAVPPARLLAHMDGDFRKRLSVAELEMSKLRINDVDAPMFRPYREANSWVAIAAAAVTMIESCTDRLYVSGHASYLEPVSRAIRHADERGIRIDVLCFGEPPFMLRNGEVLRHSSTDHIVYRHHQARHLAIVCDSTASMWALAPDGTDWDAIWADDDPLLAAVVKGFVRHDIFLQRIYRDFGEQLIQRYGPGLDGLFQSLRETVDTDAADGKHVARPA